MRKNERSCAQRKFRENESSLGFYCKIAKIAVSFFLRINLSGKEFVC